MGFTREALGAAFKKIKGAKTKEEALDRLQSSARAVEAAPLFAEGSALAFLRGLTHVPSTQQESNASMSERRRLLEARAVTINGFKLGPNDAIPCGDLLWEVTFFKGARRQASMWFNHEVVEDLYTSMRVD